MTPLARDEMAGPGAEGYQRMIEQSLAGRVGSTEEVAAAAAFLMGPGPGLCRHRPAYGRRRYRSAQC